MVLQECPECHRKVGTQNKKCKCGLNFDKAKKRRKEHKKRVRYWIMFRVPNPDGTGRKNRKEFVGFSIEEARDADGKRRGQKREGRIFEMLPLANMTFKELAKWYLELDKVKEKKSHWRKEINLKQFNEVYGDVVVANLKPVDIEGYQARRLKEGRALSTIDQEVGEVKTMIRKAWENDKVDDKTLKKFNRVGKLLKNRNANARDRILSLEEFERLMEELPAHANQVLATAFYTGMRKEEILGLTWDRVDLKNRVIRLEAQHTKDAEPRNVPILEPLYEILKAVPRRIHHDYVFTYAGKPIKDVRTALRNACEKAEIPYGRAKEDGFIFHDIRHTFNTYMQKAGVREKVIMEITGHSTREMFDRYTTVDSQDTRQAMDRFREFIASAPHLAPQEANGE